MDALRAPTGTDPLIAALAAEQHGVVSRRQLVASGVGRGAIAHRIRSRRLIGLHRGVYAVGHVHQASVVHWMAAVLACGEGAVLSHVAAAALWELRPSAASRTDVTVPGRAGRRQRRRIVVHRSVVLPQSEITVERGIPVTTVARTLLDIAPALQPHAVDRAVERAEALELFDLTAVQRTLALHPTHPGARTLTNALEIYREDELTRSDLEALMLALCDAAGLPRPLVNRMVQGQEVDFLWPHQRLIVEADGRGTHLTRQAFERDRARDAKLTIAGYRVVRFTYRQIVHERRAVTATLRALLLTSAR